MIYSRYVNARGTVPNRKHHIRTGDVRHISSTVLLAVLVAVACIGVCTGCGPAAGTRDSGGDFVNESVPGELIREAESTRVRWEIVVGAGASREFIYTNKVATHFSGEATGAHSRSYHGLFCAMHEYLDSWDLHVNGEPIDPGTIARSFAFPHVLYREYPHAGLVEEIFVPDVENGLVVRFGGSLTGECALVPWIDMRFIWDVPQPEYRIFWEEGNNLLLVSRVDAPFAQGRPRWLAVTADCGLRFIAEERRRETHYPKDAARRAMGKTYPFSPGRLLFLFEGPTPLHVTVAFGLGVSEEEAASQALRLVTGYEELKRVKLARVEGLFSLASVETENERFNRALRWARVSMDNLIMDQRGRGIYAGFHWFPNYWGRDSFICLPGACLATGAMQEAREILLSFMEYQQTESGSRHLGRFPNIVNPQNLQYAGVDGTWWLVRAAWKYYRASGDRDFLLRAFPRIELAIEGALAHAVDGLGFLTHGDGETWMDAGGEAHPYSPRGSRAVEVQALFHHGLLVGAVWARELAAAEGRGGPAAAGAGEAVVVDTTHLERLASRWEQRAQRLRESFNNLFWNRQAGTLYDHLNADGSPDGQIRPNAILALWVSLDVADCEPGPMNDDRFDFLERNRLLTHRQAASIVGTALKTICLEHGIASLSPDDPAFHPHHLNLERYYYDEAYHNGDVWEWLSGPMASCLLAVGEVETAWDLVAPLVDEILDEACVGSLREIRDGLHEEGREEFGGATSQAWSLAEFIRICHTGFIRAGPPEGGVHPGTDATGAGSPVTITHGVADPQQLPLAWGRTRFFVPLLLAPHVRPSGAYLTVRGVAVPGAEGRKRAQPLRRLR
ncbi:MAG: hypothetical protein JSV33_03885 [bacterium]|nr:MAG: hypothetical protein JSV33_03885 [bacterium]